MFASIVAYQLVDLLLAVALAAIAGRVVAGPARRLAARYPRALATPFRVLVLVELPAFAICLLGFAVIGRLWLFRWISEWSRGHPELQRVANGATFLLLGTVYAAIFVVYPVAALVRAWRARAEDPEGVARRRIDRRLATLAFGLAAAIVVDTVFIEPNRLVVERTSIELGGWPADRPALRVVLLADFQSALLSERERRAVAIVESLRPDLIVVAGDLVSPSFDESLPLEQARYVLSRLRAPLGVFVVNGDVDDAVEGGVRRAIQGTGATLLDNESVVLASDPPIELAGLDPRDAGRAAELLRQPAKAALRIGAVHRPRHYAELAAAGYPLVLAGHTHGGQVVIPGFGPPVTFETVPRAVAAGGLHLMRARTRDAAGATTQLYVTRGIGHEGGFAPPIRFLCPPEISLLEVGPPPSPALATAKR